MRSVFLLALLCLLNACASEPSTGGGDVISNGLTDGPRVLKCDPNDKSNPCNHPK